MISTETEINALRRCSKEYANHQTQYYKITDALLPAPKLASRLSGASNLLIPTDFPQGAVEIWWMDLPSGTEIPLCQKQDKLPSSLALT